LLLPREFVETSEAGRVSQLVTSAVQLVSLGILLLRRICMTRALLITFISLTSCAQASLSIRLTSTGAIAVATIPTMVITPMNSISEKPPTRRMTTDGHGEGVGRKTVHLTCGLTALTLIPCPSVLILRKFPYCCF